MPAAATAAASAVEEATIQVESSNIAASKGPQESDIAVAAYYLWVNRGCPVGSDQDDWFQAEAALKDSQRTT